MKTARLIRNAVGISFVDVLISMGLGALIISSLGSVVYFSSRRQSQDNQKISSVAARNFIYNTLNKYSTWRATLVGNAAAFSCALNNTGCTASAKGNFTLYVKDSAGASQVLYDPTNVANGLDENGATCTSATGTAPSADCPIRADLSWVPLCTSGCTDPVPISVSVSFTVYDMNRPTSPSRPGLDFTLLKSVHQRACPLPWGGTLADGGTVTAWNRANGPCSSVVRTCTDTLLDNQTDYNVEDCVCETPWGTTLARGSSVTAYLSSVGPCTSQVRTCGATDGVLSGSYTNQTCLNPCNLPWGGSINSGQSVTAWLTASGTCTSETRTCTNGTLSGTYTFQTCSNAPCNLPWGGSIAHGASVLAYQYTKQSPTCTSSQTRTCNNGTLSGSYLNQTCTTCGGVTYPSCTSSTGCTSYCWYVSDNDSYDCDQVCTGRGGCVLAGVLAYGSNGTNSECGIIADLVWGPALTGTVANQAKYIGCAVDMDGADFAERHTRPTTCGANPAASDNERRICSCTN